MESTFEKVTKVLVYVKLFAAALLILFAIIFADKGNRGYKPYPWSYLISSVCLFVSVYFDYGFYKIVMAAIKYLHSDEKHSENIKD